VVHNLNREINDKLRDMQGKVLKEINMLGCHHLINVDRIKNLRLEVMKKDDQLRSLAENTASDLTELGSAVRDRTEKLQKLSSKLDEKCLHLQEKERTVHEMNQKLKVQSALNDTLTSKIEALKNNVQSKEEELYSQSKAIERLKTEVRELPTGVKAQVSQIVQKYKRKIASIGEAKTDKLFEGNNVGDLMSNDELSITISRLQNSIAGGGD